MTVEIEGSFQVTSWDERTYEELDGGSRLTRATVTQRFTGHLQATSSWECLLYYRPDGTAFFTGLQRFAGKLEGRDGTFLAHTSGEYNGDHATTEWSVVPRSGAGELAGLEGSGTATASAGAAGSFSFHFDIH